MEGAQTVFHNMDRFAFLKGNFAIWWMNWNGDKNISWKTS